MKEKNEGAAFASDQVVELVGFVMLMDLYLGSGRSSAAGIIAQYSCPIGCNERGNQVLSVCREDEIVKGGGIEVNLADIVDLEMSPRFMSEGVPW